MAHGSEENAPTPEEGFALVAKYVDISVNSIKDMRMCLSYDIDNITSEFPYKLYTMTAGFRDTFR